MKTWKTTFEMWEMDRVSYVISKSPKGFRASVQRFEPTGKDRVFNYHRKFLGHSYKTRTEARKACERHLKRGK